MTVKIYEKKTIYIGIQWKRNNYEGVLDFLKKWKIGFRYDSIENELYVNLFSWYEERKKDVKWTPLNEYDWIVVKKFSIPFILSDEEFNKKLFHKNEWTERIKREQWVLYGN